jgi:hypothetical protein
MDLATFHSPSPATILQPYNVQIIIIRIELFRGVLAKLDQITDANELLQRAARAAQHNRIPDRHHCPPSLGLFILIGHREAIASVVWDAPDEDAVEQALKLAVFGEIGTIGTGIEDFY